VFVCLVWCFAGLGVDLVTFSYERVSGAPSNLVDDPMAHFSKKGRAAHNEPDEGAASRIEIRVGLDWQGHQFRNLVRIEKSFYPVICLLQDLGVIDDGIEVC
jgi:hypothetical protein